MFLVPRFGNAFCHLLLFFAVLYLKFLLPGASVDRMPRSERERRTSGEGWAALTAPGIILNQIEYHESYWIMQRSFLQHNFVVLFCKDPVSGYHVGLKPLKLSWFLVEVEGWWVSEVSAKNVEDSYGTTKVANINPLDIFFPEVYII